MSWSASFTQPVRKVEAAAYIDRLSTGAQVEGPAVDQCELAKKAAKELLAGIPGPFVQVTLSGHANGVGWQQKDGWANDAIYISIAQVTEPPALPAISEIPQPVALPTTEARPGENTAPDLAVHQEPQAPLSGYEIAGQKQEHQS